MKKHLKKIIRLNIFFTSAMIICDFFIVHPHTNDSSFVVHQVSASNQMKIKHKHNNVHSDEEQEFSNI
ncbi:hypothetical protein ATN96_10965 [Companilactobacillus paralimentarius]|nr:hypothetical protein ATN96_10965 [Companilactobacillus paralimentarius]